MTLLIVSFYFPFFLSFFRRKDVIFDVGLCSLNVSGFSLSSFLFISFLLFHFRFPLALSLSALLEVIFKYINRIFQKSIIKNLFLFFLLKSCLPLSPWYTLLCKTKERGKSSLNRLLLVLGLFALFFPLHLRRLKKSLLNKNILFFWFLAIGSFWAFLPPLTYRQG